MFYKNIKKGFRNNYRHTSVGITKKGIDAFRTLNNNEVMLKNIEYVVSFRDVPKGLYRINHVI